MSDTAAALVCPKCQGAMRAYERNGVTIDQCTDCRGIFLDRGELERLSEAEDAHYGGSRGGRREQSVPAPTDSRGGSPDERDMEHGEPRERKRRGGFLGDLLDFG